MLLSVKVGIYAILVSGKSLLPLKDNFAWLFEFEHIIDTAFVKSLEIIIHHSVYPLAS